MKTQKTRLDVLVCRWGLAPTVAKAQALILAGVIRSGDTPLTKAGMLYPDDTPLTLKTKAHPFASRGGVKLAAALAHFSTIDVRGSVAIDIGASTGGFTDVLLRAGAKRVYAVDVGYGQLAWPLRIDERVVVLEKTNARYLSEAVIGETVDVVVCDASFISLKTVLPAALGVLKSGGVVAALIKPQFEVAKEQVEKGGVVRDGRLHQQVCDTIAGWLEGDMGFAILGITPSPITGPGGNKEFIIAGVKG